MEQTALKVDRTQELYLKYLSALTGQPLSSLIHDIVEEWLDVSYPVYVGDIEERRGLPRTTANGDDSEASHKAFDNMLKNLKSLESRKRKNRKPLGRVIAFKPAAL